MATAKAHYPNSDNSDHIAATSRLVLRRIVAGDAGFLCALLNDPSWLKNIGDRNVRTPEDAEQYIHDKLVASYTCHGFGMYVVELKSSGSPIGLCGLVKRDSLPNPDIGFALLPAFWNRGYGLEAAKAVMIYARRELNLSTLLAIVKPSNAASIKLLEGLGFIQDGLHRTPSSGEDLLRYVTAD